MTMIEEVARAIELYKKAHQDSDTEDQWWTYEGMARAAIESMRVPSPEMAVAVQERHSPWQGGVSVVWMDMIDAALEEGK